MAEKQEDRGWGAGPRFSKAAFSFTDRTKSVSLRNLSYTPTVYRLLGVSVWASDGACLGETDISAVSWDEARAQLTTQERSGAPRRHWVMIMKLPALHRPSLCSGHLSKCRPCMSSPNASAPGDRCC